VAEVRIQRGKVAMTHHMEVVYRYSTERVKHDVQSTSDILKLATWPLT
jgi:hypothetical protein